MLKRIKEDNILNTGIDTLCLEVNSDHTAQKIAEVGQEIGVMKSNYKRSGENKIISIKPAMVVNSNKLITSAKECLELTEGILIGVDSELERVIRIDVAIDLNLNLENFKKLARFFILSMSFVRNIESAFSVKSLRDLREKTVKFISDRYELTIYSKEDQKLHEAESRIEFRNKRLSDESLVEALKKSIEAIKKNLAKLTEVIKNLEEEVSKVLLNIYRKEMKNEEIATFSDFVIRYTGYIYTKEIFKKLYKHSGLKSSPDKFLENFRKGKKNAIPLYKASDLKKMSEVFIKKIQQFEDTF